MMMLLNVVSAKSVSAKKSERQTEKVDEVKSNDDDDGWSTSSSNGNYIGDWNQPEIKQVTIERKVPVYVERIRHVPIIQKEYISVPKFIPIHITKPIYIERSAPSFILPRMQFHHHHYAQYHHLH